MADMDRDIARVLVAEAARTSFDGDRLSAIVPPTADAGRIRLTDLRIGSDGADSVSLSDSENGRGTPDADWARCSLPVGLREALPSSSYPPRDGGRDDGDWREAGVPGRDREAVPGRDDDRFPFSAMPGRDALLVLAMIPTTRGHKPWVQPPFRGELERLGISGCWQSGARVVAVVLS